MNPASAALRMFLIFCFFVTAWVVNILPRADLYLHGKVVEGTVYGSVGYSGLWATYEAESARNNHSDTVVFDGYEAPLGTGWHRYKGETHVRVYYSEVHPENFVLREGPYSLFDVIFHESFLWIGMAALWFCAFLFFYRQTLAERAQYKSEQERQRLGNHGEPFRGYALPSLKSTGGWQRSGSIRVRAGIWVWPFIFYVLCYCISTRYPFGDSSILLILMQGLQIWFVAGFVFWAIISCYDYYQHKKYSAGRQSIEDRSDTQA